ncbi:MAG: hypothetical protein HY093_03545 [Candidatus Liptonbacteria bacterium]|nr:hypothetical protein [Candidatus Liptonbacteria bacterium]
MWLNNYLNKLLVLLRAQPQVGGLEIADSALRFARFIGREWQMVSLRLPPGVVKAGQVADYGQLVLTLKQLKGQLPHAGSDRQNISAVVCLGSLNVYTQVMSLPDIEESRLDEAVRLNIQMVSPANAAEIYSGWQIVGKNESERKLDILSAFVNRSVVDEISKALKEAGFLGVVFESRAMAIARLVREKAVGINQARSHLIFILDNDVFDILVTRGGELYFEYLNYWKDLRGENKLISLLDFRNMVVSNLRKVFNFYSQHWSQDIENVILVATGLNDEIKKIVKENFSLEARELEISLDRPVTSEWYNVLGSGLRGIKSRKDDREISLFVTSARDEFREEQVVSFMKFWRLLIPVALGWLLIFFLATNFILMRKVGTLKSSGLMFDSVKSKEVENLQNEAKLFNRYLGLISARRSLNGSKTLALERISKLMSDNNITPDRFSFRDFNSRIVLLGEAKTNAQILDFEKALQTDPQISQVDLSLTEIKPSPQGFSFSISFAIIPGKSE